MDIFRNTISGFGISPTRRVFGLHPNTGKILVPIDICMLTSVGLDNNLPVNVIGADVLTSPAPSLLGKIALFDLPIFGIDVNPFVELDNSSANIKTINSVDINTIQVGDLVSIEGTTVSGKIFSSISGVTSGFGLLRKKPFPIDMGLTIQGIEIDLDTPLGDGFQGSPVIMKNNNQVLGMLLGKGIKVLACPLI
jgi:hypothetical protein